MKVVRTLSVVEKAVFLMQTDIFKSLATDEVALIAVKSTENEFEAGELVEKGSEAGRSFHVVIEGAVEVSRNSTVFRRATKGMYFGLLPLLEIQGDEEVRAVEPTHTLVLSCENFKQAVADNPQFALTMIRSVATMALNFALRVEELEKAGAGR